MGNFLFEPIQINSVDADVTHSYMYIIRTRILRVITQKYIYLSMHRPCIDLNCEYTYHGFMMSQRLNILQMLILAEEKDILIHKIQQSCAFWFHKFKATYDIYPLLYKYIALLWEGVILLTYIITSSLYIDDTMFDTCAHFLKWT